MPIPATAWRHRDPGVRVPGHGAAWDPVIFLGLVAFQSEPFQPGAYYWGHVDPVTGAVDLHVDVVDHPLDRAASYHAAVPMARALVGHLTPPHVARHDRDGQPVEAIDDHATAALLPRVLVANTAAVRALGYLGRRFTYLKVPDDADAATAADLGLVRAAGRWLREIDAIAKYTGQSQVVDLLEMVSELYVVPLPPEERAHLGAVCAAISSGPAGGWAAESDFVGPVPDPQTQDELWEMHNHLRDRMRGSVSGGAGVARTRRQLQRRYEMLGADMIRTCCGALDLLVSVPGEPTLATARRAEDLKRYASAGSRAVGWNQPGRSVRPLLDNAEVVERRELARSRHELRMQMLEPRLRAPLWGTGGAFDGVRRTTTPRKVPVGGSTPTGRTKMGTEWEVDVEVHDLIELPRVGDGVLWCGHLGMKVQGVVRSIQERMVTIHVPPKTSNSTSLRDRSAGEPDAWLVARAPYLAENRNVPRAERSALFRTPWVEDAEETVGNIRNAEVDAVISAAGTADKDYQ